MKLLTSLLIAILLGDCVQLVKGVFKGQYWIVTASHTDGTFDLKQGPYVLRDVRGSYLKPVGKACPKEEQATEITYL